MLIIEEIATTVTIGVHVRLHQRRHRDLLAALPW